MDRLRATYGVLKLSLSPSFFRKTTLFSTIYESKCCLRKNLKKFKSKVGFMYPTRVFKDGRNNKFQFEVESVNIKQKNIF